VRRVVAFLGILWAGLNLIVGAFFVTGSFTATTAAKEGIAAQLALLTGGSLIGIFGALLARSSWNLFMHRTGQ
jgi:hypothetical protein